MDGFESSLQVRASSVMDESDQCSYLLPEAPHLPRLRPLRLLPLNLLPLTPAFLP